MSFIIRSIKSTDIPEMYKISVAAHQAGYAEFIPEQERARFDARYNLSNQEREDRFYSSMNEKMNDPNWLFWVAEDEGKVLGYTLALKENEHLLHKKGMFVHPDHQGEGVGSALFKASLEGISSGVIDLVVIASNERAKHIYSKNGFVATGHHDKPFFGTVQEVMELQKA